MTGRFLKELKERKGLRYDKVSVIGFSLGVPVAGEVGEWMNGTIKQIVGKAFGIHFPLKSSRIHSERSKFRDGTLEGLKEHGTLRKSNVSNERAKAVFP